MGDPGKLSAPPVTLEGATVDGEAGYVIVKKRRVVTRASRNAGGSKEVNTLLRKVHDADGVVVRCGSGHFLVRGPLGSATVAATPGRNRSLANSYAAIRRYTGLQIKGGR